MPPSTRRFGPPSLKLHRRPAIPTDIVIRLQGGHPADFLAWLRRTGQEFLPDTPLNISFLDDNFGRLAEKERLLGQAITFFTALAILLATLGLIGLTLFTIERRTKEIGIRKVLGAGRISILRLISGDFIRLALIASAIALPISWWLINRWLNNFAYRVIRQRRDHFPDRIPDRRHRPRRYRLAYPSGPDRQPGRKFANGMSPIPGSASCAASCLTAIRHAPPRHDPGPGRPIHGRALRGCIETGQFLYRNRTTALAIVV